MLAFVATAVLLALTRAEIIERFKAPVVTQADGLVKVFADCPEDMRREFQTPVAGFAAETAKTLYQGLAKKPLRFRQPGIVIHVGDVRTNLADVVSRVSTNDSRAVTRIWLKAPGSADLYRFRLELIKAFYRSVEGKELSDDEAVAAYRHADPALRVADERMKLEDWLAGRGTQDDEEGLRLMRKIFQPGRSSPRDILIFASRLFLYPPQRDIPFLGRFDCLSFRAAVKFARNDPLTRLVAFRKSSDLPVFGGGRSPELAEAADAYRLFLMEFARAEKSEAELLDLLEAADAKLSVAYERAMRQ